MTAQAFCSNCGSARIAGARFCPGCGRPFDDAAAAAPVAPLATSPTAEPLAEKKKGINGLTVLLLIGAIAIIGVLIAPMLGTSLGGGGVSTANLPPAGEIWFGTNFDASTFELTGRSSSGQPSSPLAAVAHLTKTMDASQLNVRSYVDGQLIGNQSFNAKGSGDVWGWTVGPLFVAGVYKYELTDIGGNVLASGTFTAT